MSSQGQPQPPKVVYPPTEPLEVGSSALPVGHSVRILKKNPKADETATAAKAGMDLPKSRLMQRLEAFLPQMEKANRDLDAKLAAEGADAVNIEAVDEDEEHILMDVVIGPMGDDDAIDDGDHDDGEDDSSEDDLSHGEKHRPLIKEMD